MRRNGDKEAARRGYENSFGRYKRGALSNEEKAYIAKGWTENQTVLEIATVMRRHTSTVRNIFNIYEGKPTLSLSLVLTEAEFNQGRDAKCLGCGFGPIDCHTNGNGSVYEECRKCKWTQHFGR